MSLEVTEIDVASLEQLLARIVPRLDPTDYALRRGGMDYKESSESVKTCVVDPLVGGFRRRLGVE